MLGVFDSGIGGLTVVNEITRLYPRADIIYIGDTARVPWGNRSPETIRHFSVQLTKFLIQHSVNAIIIACHTASSVALDEVKSTSGGLPVVGMIDASVRQASNVSTTQRIGVIGTRVTIDSGTWVNALQKLTPQSQIFSHACPLFVPLVEEGLENHPASDVLIDHYLESLKAQHIDTLILACTHYPFLAPKIQSYFGNNVALINPGVAVAASLDRSFTKGEGRINLLFTDQKPPKNKFIRLLANQANVKINSVSLSEIEHE